MGLRGLLRGFVLKVGLTIPRSFTARSNHQVAGQTKPDAVARALLAVQAMALREFRGAGEAGTADQQR